MLAVDSDFDDVIPGWTPISPCGVQAGDVQLVSCVCYGTNL